MKEERYDIGGMHCAACSSAVERVTKKLPGVERSEVNLPMNWLTIVYDENQTTPQMIIDKVEKSGFTARQKLDEHETVQTMKAENENNVLKKEKASLIISVVFAALLLVVSMGQMLFSNMPIPALFSIQTHPVNFAILQMLLTIPVLVIGKRFFIGGFKSMLHRNPNMDSLVALSATASFIYSVVMTLLITDNPHTVHNLYFESAAVVVALVSVGKYLEAKNKEKTKSAIAGLMELAPEMAMLVDENGQWEVPTERIKVGDTVLVKPGARVPLDGVVIEGAGSINESMLTGESMPAEKAQGSEVIGGSVLVNGAIFVRVTRIGSDTTLSKIIKFVEDAQGKKAPISKTADKVAGVFVPSVIGIAILSSVIWLLSGAEFSFALKIFTAVLVIACPCAMGLATPTAIIVGTGLGASKGILIRNGEALETTHKITVAVFDKTGTITEGKPTVTEIITKSKNENEVLSIAYAVEQLSNHPLSQAISQEANRRNITGKVKITEFQNHTGLGVSAKDQNGNQIFVGNMKLMREKQFLVDDYATEIEHLQAQGKTAVLVAKNDTLQGVIAIADTMKPDAKIALQELKKMGIKTVLLTGDNTLAAHYIGEKAGVDEIVADVLPTEKAEVIKQYQQKNDIVMMVGDGINDAPALAQADSGCAIGNGSDIAIDSAQIVLMKNELYDVCRAIRLSHLTIRNIKQNLFWAFFYNTLGIPIAAGILYPSFGLLLSPMIGGLAMSLSSLFVVGNALRLKGKKV